MLLRGIRWRLGASLLTLLTAAIAVGAAVLGPLYLRSAGDSLVRSAVVAAPSQSSGITLTPGTGSQISLAKLRGDEQALTRKFGLDQWYEPSAIATVVSGVGLTQPGGSPLRSALLYRTDICAVLRFKSGGCRLKANDVLVSDRSARKLKVSVGSTLEVTPLRSTKPLRLHVSGIYAVPSFSLSYWWGGGRGYFPYGYSTEPGHIPEIDGLITSRSTAQDVPSSDLPAYTIQLPLRRNSVGLQSMGDVERALSDASRAAALRGIQFDTTLPKVLARATHQQHLMTTVVVVAAVQLVLLAVWVLTALLLRSADLRRSELRVARLRGFPLVSVVAVTIAEPGLLCAAGTVLGVAGAWIAVLVTKSVLLSPATTISVGPWVLVAFAAAVAVIAAVLGLSALRVLRDSDFAQSTPARGPTSNRLRLVGDAVLLVLSAVALVALATSGALENHANPIASAAPGLLALGTTVIAIQLVLAVCRRGVTATADSSRVAAGLALRQVVRRPALLREARVLIVALCLACFATSAWSIARSNRETAANFSVGAATVATVTPQGVGLQQAVDRVDPAGHFAMAAIQISTASTSLLAVDASRLPAVISWPTGVSSRSVQAVSRALTPTVAPQVKLGATRVAIRAAVPGPGELTPRARNLDLSLWVFNAHVGTSIVSLGALQPGSHLYTGKLAVDCPGGCTLAGVGLVPESGRPVPSSGRVELTLSGLYVGRGSGPIAATSHNLAPDDWSAGAQVHLDRSGSGSVTFQAPASLLSSYESATGSVTPPMISVADHPTNIPGAVGALAAAGATASGGAEVVASQGIDGNSISIHAVAPVTAVPRIGRSGELVDLALLRRYQSDPAVTASRDEVWLGPDAPSDALSRLRAAGLQIDGVQRASKVFARLQRGGSALAYDFMLFATIVALLAAIVSTLGVLGSSRRQRATELTALEVAGIPRPVLMHSLAIESVILALTALFGAVAGAVGTAMVAPALPQLSGKVLAPLSFSLPWLLIVVVSLAVVAVVIITTTLAGVGIVRHMSPTLLRAAPDDAGN